MKLFDRKYRVSGVIYFVGGAIATTLISLPLFPAPALIQLIPDRSLGTEAPVSSPAGAIAGLPTPLFKRATGRVDPTMGGGLTIDNLLVKLGNCHEA